MTQSKDLDASPAAAVGSESGSDVPGAGILPFLFAMRRVCAFAAVGAATVSAIAICFACLAITWAVFARGIFGLNTIWEMEASVYLLIYAAFLSAAYTDRSGGQIGVRLVTDRLSGRASRIQRLLLDILALALFSLIAYSGWSMFIHSWETGWRSPTVWGPPLWLPHLAIPLGAGLLVVSLVVDIAIRLSGGTIEEPKAEAH